MTTPEALRALYENRETRALRNRAAGPMLVGVLGTTVPVELIEAAGMRAMRLCVEPPPAGERGRPYIEDVREGYLRAIFEKILEGAYDQLDLLVIPRSSEGLLQFYYLLEEVRRVNPGWTLPPLHLFDILHTRTEASLRYTEARIEVLKARLEALSKRPIEDGAIADSIRRHNRMRNALRRWNAGRRRTPATVSGTTMLELTGCAQTLPSETTASLLRDDIAPAALDGVRLMVKGFPVERSEFYGAIEAQGAVVVADDHEWGEGLFAFDVDEKLPPIEALARYYTTQVPCPRRLPQSESDARFLALAEAARVQGVVFVLEENDDTLGWDVPAQRRQLDAQGIPSLLLTRQTTLPDEPSLARIASFVEEVRHGHRV